MNKCQTNHKKEKSAFPSVDELAKANIKADTLKRTIPSNTYVENTVTPKSTPNLQLEIAKEKFRKGEKLSLNERLLVDKHAADTAKKTNTPAKKYI